MLLKCVESILAGSRRPDEIVVVGREGDDAEREAIAAIESALHAGVRIRSAWVTEPGHVPPVEKGARTASSDLVAIVDDDVTVTREWLSSLVPHFADPGVGVWGGACWCLARRFRRSRADQGAFRGTERRGVTWEA